MQFVSETVLPKNHGQVCLDSKGYQDTLLFKLNANPPIITKDTHIGKNKVLPQSCGHNLEFPTGKCAMVY